MNRIEELLQGLRARVPGVEGNLDRPKAASGPWFLDLRAGSNAAVVEWRSGLGFGVTSLPSRAVYGDDAPDEFFFQVDELEDRLVELLVQGEKTSPPATMDLRGLRERRFVTQGELAALIGVTQATISKLERRGEDVDFHILRSVARALGGELEVNIRFAGNSVAVSLSGEPSSEPPQGKTEPHLAARR